MARPAWDDYFLRMAELAASRSTCPRRHVGAVLVRDRQVVATGYNGSVRGDVHCEDAGCLLENGHCVRCVHAELNALLQCAASSQTSAGTTMYCTDFPCLNCAKAMVQARVSAVVYRLPYPDERSCDVLRRAGVALYRATAGSDGYVLVREA